MCGLTMNQDNLPDKCNFCGLKQTWEFDTEVKTHALRTLFEKGIIKHRFTRKLYVILGDNDKDDKTEFCLIHNPSWLNKTEKCDSWQLDVGLPKGDCLAINLAEEATIAAKETERLTSQLNSLTVDIRDMTKKIKFFTIAMLIIAIVQVCISLINH